ncbi:M23 family metallopeptidase [bacterium]|jgi:murein DD-endopeptidase MepM/ murein hydrolase activator NlpD|nr:M23 family metallopeptidase [bacterium]MBT4335588.1 M23 family metallopeptidase [bacterium]MBT4495585.1 M23 family metallopeptidase [bacterium]MBT4764243.1 M23 family metallopeptidase [bacterium]MBT5401615.1 M23 family metallopeptidase [bacterium]
MKNIRIYISIIFLVAIAIFLLLNNQSNLKSDDALDIKEPIITERLESIEITPNSTFGALMSDNGVPSTVTAQILKASEEVYDLVKIRTDRSLDLYYDIESNKFKKLVYQIDTEEELFVTLEGNEWVAERKDIPYEIRIKTSEGELITSMYQTALDNDIDVRVIIDLADAYQWNIDFAIDPRVGDTFKFIYEERYRDNEYVMPGKILASLYVNAGTEHRIYYFEEHDENKGYFDPEGNSVQKMFLKAPIQYKYISSGFTTGLRCLSYYQLCTNHRALDYAAASGTPIRAVGDGTVMFAGWNSGGYGNLTKIRHNATYSTNYAHQSRIIVKYGQKVVQGEIIGYVGSTGLSTGPHLHYEMVKYGTKIDARYEVLPPGEAIKEENMSRYYSDIENYKNQLN